MANRVLGRAFASLNVSGFRYMWFGDFALQFAEFMEIVILSWYVLEQTNSPFILGVFAALNRTGTLASPFFGVAVDRIGRRGIYLFSRASFVLLSTTVLILSMLDLLTVIAVLVIGALIGLVRSLDLIVRQSVLPVVVASTQLQNSVALLRSGRDITQIIGPICGGLLLEMIGVGKSYFFIVALYSMSFGFVMMIPGIPNTSYGLAHSVFADLKGGLSYIKINPFLLGLLVVAFIVNLTAFPLNTLLVVIAREVMTIDARGLGWLMGAYATGALMGSLIISYFSNMRRASRAMLIGAVLWHIGIITMAYTKWFYVSLPILVFLGVSQSFTMVTMAMLLLRYTSEEMRGRVMGLRQLAVYGLPVGLLISGFVTEATNVSLALVFNGLLGLILLGLIIITLPAMLAHIANNVVSANRLGED